MDALQNGPFARPSLLKRAIGLVMATRTRGAAATTTPLERELEQARNGNHPRQVAEGKRLEQMKISRLQQADQLRKYRLSIVGRRSRVFR